MPAWSCMHLKAGQVSTSSLDLQACLSMHSQPSAGTILICLPRPWPHPKKSGAYGHHNLCHVALLLLRFSRTSTFDTPLPYFGGHLFISSCLPQGPAFLHAILPQHVRRGIRRLDVKGAASPELVVDNLPAGIVHELSISLISFNSYREHTTRPTGETPKACTCAEGSPKALAAFYHVFQSFAGL